MKKFAFKLQRILNYRETIKDERKRILILKNQKLFNAEERLKNLEEAVINNGIPSGIVNINLLILTGDYGAYLLSEIERQKEVIEEIKIEVNEAKEAYLEASKDAKSLQLLKEKKETEYKKNLLKEEEKENDNIATQRFKILERV
ncbi:MAG: flagellar export protein FliJ [Bdellovibrionota bacterium]